MFFMDALRQAIKLSGGQGALARAINSSPQAINNWLARGKVPAQHCPSIELATFGAVTCEDLRPDVAWSVLRSSHEQAAA